jgi:hypothetical protein
MARLGDLAFALRSKNAGPYEVTIDILFSDHAVLSQVLATGILGAALFSRLYGVPEPECNYLVFPAGMSIKCTMPRLSVSGNIDDTDVYGCQQYAPLLDIDIPISG